MIIEHSDKKYTILRELGKGHSGVVYLATDSQGKEVAVKCLARELNERTLQRFRHEFLTLRSLIHPHISQPVDFGLDEGKKQFFFVTEYIPGLNLDWALERADEKTALGYFAQALKALDYLHRQGVFHCDLKPQNILVTRDGKVKLIDFDLATRGGSVLGGTPSYFAPELLANLNSAAGASSDLFSLGATFYHGLTGESPYPGKTLPEIRESHYSHVPPLPSQLNRNLKPVWDGLLMGLLAVNPSRRYRTASSALQQVLPLLGEKTNLLSAEEIEYRLAQHGLPIGREDLLRRAKAFLDQEFDFASGEKRIWILEGEPGAGTSHLLEEIRILAQLKGLNSFVLNRSQRGLPETYPFVWIIDDLASLSEGSAEEFPRVSSKLKEIQHREEGERWWIVAGGLPPGHAIPQGLFLRPLSSECRSSVSHWKEKETRVWLEDVFQAGEVPGFLIDLIQKQSGGNPKKSSRLLKNYLEKGLILDDRGSWRKDLFHPSPLFLDTFLKTSPWEKEGRWIKKLTPEEEDLVLILSAAYGPVPDGCLEGWLGTERVYSELKRLTGAKILIETDEGRYQIAHPELRNILEERYGLPEFERRHDEWARRLESNAELKSLFPPEALFYHRAHGRDGKRAAEAWAFFGDGAARRGLWQSAGEHYTRAYERTHPDDAEKRLEYAVQIGKCLVGKNQLSDAEKFFLSLLKEFSTPVAGECPSSRFLAKIRERLGLIELKRGNLDQARRFFEEGIRLLEPEREPLEQYLALKNFLAGLDLASGDFEAAIRGFQESDEEAEKTLSWERKRVLTNNDLAAALLKAGRFDEAVAHWKKTLRDLKRREDKTPLARCYYQMAQAHLERGLSNQALGDLLKAQKASVGTQNFEMDLRICNALGNLYVKEDPSQALSMFEKALDAAFKTSDLFSTAAVLFNMGFLLAETGEPARAAHALDQGLVYLSAAKNPDSAPLFHRAHLELSNCWAELMKGEEALAHAREALRMVEENGSLKAEQWRTQLVCWQALLLAGEEKEALALGESLRRHAKGPGELTALFNQEERNKDLRSRRSFRQGQAVKGERPLVQEGMSETTLMTSPDDAEVLKPLIRR